MTRLIAVVLLAVATFSVEAVAAVYMHDNFDSYSPSTWQANGNWDTTTDTAVQTSGCYSGNCIRMAYVDSWHSVSKSLGDGYPEGYISFRAKVTNKQASWPKFLKFFGTISGGLYNNWTLGTGSYSTPALGGISHGGDISPDTNCVMKWYSGVYNCTTTLEYYSGSRFYWDDENWHLIVAYYKMNTNGNADGKFSVWIDGILQLRATGVINRRDAAPRSFKAFAFGDYVPNDEDRAGDLVTVPTYYLWFDDFKLTSTYEEATGGDPPPTIQCWKDEDTDHYGNNIDEFVTSCSIGYYTLDHFISITGDCDDTANTVYPGATEICGDGIIQDCTRTTDLSCTPSPVSVLRGIRGLRAE